MRNLPFIFMEKHPHKDIIMLCYDNMSFKNSQYLPIPYSIFVYCVHILNISFVSYLILSLSLIHIYSSKDSSLFLFADENHSCACAQSQDCQRAGDHAVITGGRVLFVAGTGTGGGIRSAARRPIPITAAYLALVRSRNRAVSYTHLGRAGRFSRRRSAPDGP